MTIAISVWSDIACPWCFVGKQRLEQALAQFARDAGAPEVRVTWRAFELDPRPRAPDHTPYAERLAKKYNRSVQEATQMIATMADNIRAEGGRADFDRIIVANTFNAHRLIQWAGQTDSDGLTRGAQHALTDALMRGYLGQGLNLADTEALLSPVIQLALDEKAARDVLDSDAFADVVREDEALAQQYGIQGVPFFVIGQYGLSGAQASTTLLEVLHTVQSEATE